MSRSPARIFRPPELGKLDVLLAIGLINVRIPFLKIHCFLESNSIQSIIVEKKLFLR